MLELFLLYTFFSQGFGWPIGGVPFIEIADEFQVGDIAFGCVFNLTTSRTGMVFNMNINEKVVDNDTGADPKSNIEGHVKVSKGTEYSNVIFNWYDGFKQTWSDEPQENPTENHVNDPLFASSRKICISMQKYFPDKMVVVTYIEDPDQKVAKEYVRIYTKSSTMPSSKFVQIRGYNNNLDYRDHTIVGYKKKDSPDYHYEKSDTMTEGYMAEAKDFMRLEDGLPTIRIENDFQIGDLAFACLSNLSNVDNDVFIFAFGLINDAVPLESARSIEAYVGLARKPHSKYSPSDETVLTFAYYNPIAKAWKLYQPSVVGNQYATSDITCISIKKLENHQLSVIINLKETGTGGFGRLAMVFDSDPSPDMPNAKYAGVNIISTDYQQRRRTILGYKKKDGKEAVISKPSTVSDERAREIIGIIDKSAWR